MKSKLKRITGIIKTAGINKAAEMAIIKLERGFIKAFTHVIIPLSVLIPRKTTAGKNVLILLEQRFSVSALNRAFDLSEYLTAAGFNVKIASQLKSLIAVFSINNYPVIVFQRCATSKLINLYLKLAAERRIKTVYDCDDLLFDPSVVSAIPEDVESSTERLLRIAEEHGAVYRKCAYFLTTTDYLLQRSVLTGEAKKKLILRNGLNSLFIKKCEETLKSGKEKKENVVIGYMSGTATHNRDFKLVQNALLKIMRKHKNVFVKITGILDAPDFFNSRETAGRIIRTPFVNFYKLPSVINDFDINIAPSEIGNPFNEGKSELKYVYSGFLAIPTAASATDAFKTAITHNENGFLCRSEQDWFEALDTLISSPQKRITTGLKAKVHIENEYAPEVMSRKAGAVFNEIFTAAE
jgi:glycosyltransferase involved in cell wall biosynthesis